MQYKRTNSNYYRVTPDAGERALPMLTALLDGEGERFALELRHAVQLWLRSLSDEDEMRSVASVYPVWTPGRDYAAGEILRYDLDEIGDPQLYRVLQAHTAQADWVPNMSDSLFAPIGLSDDGMPLWVQPLGAADAYEAGDLVEYKGKKYVSVIDGNVWSPEAYPAGWKAQ